jgi:DNA-directed RNA polymerase specialized sigma24 family protein
VAPPPSSSGAVAAIEDEAPPSMDAGESGVIVALRRFLASRQKDEGRQFVWGVVVLKLYGPRPKKINVELVEDITHLAIVRALEAKTPPWTVGGIRGWVRRVTKCVIADYFSEREDDEEYLEPGVEVADLAGDRHGPHTDWGAREHLVAKYIESQIGEDAYKVESFRMMMENGVAGRSLDELAAEHRTTPTALSNRFLRLRAQLAPRVSIMDREKPRRAILLALFFLGAAALVALAIVLWSHLFPLPPSTILPVPSASAAPAPAPSFDNALPTAPDDDAGPTDLKPKPPR